MATKTWKIGEVCRGGVITVEIKGKVISVIGKEWDTSAGYKKSSNQSNAKEWTRGTVISNEKEAHWKLFNFISDLSTSYWADTIIKWIESKVELKDDFYW